MNKKTITLAVSVFILALIGILLSNISKWQKGTYSNTSFVMGTVFSMELTAKEDPTLEFVKLANNLEKEKLSRRITSSEIAKINESAGNPEGYPLSSDMEKLLTACLDVSEKSEGAFDITLGTLIELWDIDGWAGGENGEASSFVPPTEEDIQNALSFCGYEKVKIEDHRIYIPAGMIIDLGAVGKGLYLDECKSIATEDISGIISAGGSVLPLGEKADGSSWKVGITDPFRSGELYGTIAVTGGKCVSTSGNYERFVEYEGKKYHHILDSKTGYPAWLDGDDSGIASVTVVSDSGLLSDALSTACYVAGEERAIALADEFSADIVIVGNDGSYRSNNSELSFMWCFP